MKKNEVKVIWGGRKKTVIPKMWGGGNFSLGVDGFTGLARWNDWIDWMD